MNNLVNDRILEAIELFHYSWRFRNSRFVIGLSPSCSINPILDDIKILLSSHIGFCIVCFEQPGREDKINTLRQRGLPLEYVKIDSIDTLKSDESHFCFNVAQENPRVFAIESSGEKNDLSLLREAINTAAKLNADRVFFLSKIDGIRVNGKLKSHLSCDELQKLISSGSEMHGPKEILDLVLEHSRKKLEFSILNAERGSLFQEIFTHEGCGTLVAETYENIIRPAESKDVLAIHRLLAPSVGQGFVLEISEEEIAKQIDSFFVYTINSSVVGAAALKNHGKHSELGKFCTLPKFQSKGRARELAKYMIDTSKAAGQQSVFALSTNPTMWKLFQSLEMKEVERDTLPKSWTVNYDFSRPSKAFQLRHDS